MPLCALCRPFLLLFSSAAGLSPFPRWPCPGRAIRRRRCASCPPADPCRGSRDCPAAAAIGIHRADPDHVTANGQKAQAKAQYFPTLTPSYQYQDTPQHVLRRHRWRRHDNHDHNHADGRGRHRHRRDRNWRHRDRNGGTGTGTGTGTGDRHRDGRHGNWDRDGTGGTGRPAARPRRPLAPRASDGVSVTRGSGATLAQADPVRQRHARIDQRPGPAQPRRRPLRPDRHPPADHSQRHQSFYDLLRANDLVKVSQAQVTRAQQTVAQTQGQIDAGVAAARRHPPVAGRPRQCPGQPAAKRERRPFHRGCPEKRHGDRDQRPAPARDPGRRGRPAAPAERRAGADAGRLCPAGVCRPARPAAAALDHRGQQAERQAGQDQRRPGRVRRLHPDLPAHQRLGRTTGPTRSSWSRPPTPCSTRVARAAASMSPRRAATPTWTAWNSSARASGWTSSRATTTAPSPWSAPARPDRHPGRPGQLRCRHRPPPGRGRHGA